MYTVNDAYATLRTQLPLRANTRRSTFITTLPHNYVPRNDDAAKKKSDRDTQRTRSFQRIVREEKIKTSFTTEYFVENVQGIAGVPLRTTPSTLRSCVRLVRK